MKIDVFEPHGFVRYVNHCGSELDIVNAARVSFHKEVETVSDGDKKLLNFLLTNKHGTPFEQGFMAHFHVRVPLFVMREWIRHRIGFSYNEESGRYVELRPDFFDPDPATIRTQVGKPGSYSYEQHPDRGVREAFCGELIMQSRRGFDLYRQYLDLGVAKEQARWFLGLTLFTEFRWTCNARSMMNFLALRNSDDAQWEIKQYAEALEEIFAMYMPSIHGTFVEKGRVAP